MRISDWSSDVCSSDLRGTFTHLNLANNLISDEGVEVLINELKTHELLEELNLSDNKISNKGLADLSILVKELRKLRCLNISKNYGPSQEILEIGRASCRERVCKYV